MNGTGNRLGASDLVLRAACVFLGCLVVAGCPAPAADAIAPSGLPDLTDLSLEELANVKVASVYGASKHEQIEYRL